MSAAPTRRAVLGRAALAAPAVALALPGSAAAVPDPHPGWAAEAAAEAARAEALPDGTPDEVSEPYYDRTFELWDLIGSTPARTAAGAAVQVRLVLNCHREGSCLGRCEELALENALATLDRLAAERRAFV